LETIKVGKFNLGAQNKNLTYFLTYPCRSFLWKQYNICTKLSLF